MTLTNKTKIKQACTGYHISADAIEALEEQIQNTLKKACQRAEANGRRTIMAKDI